MATGGPDINKALEDYRKELALLHEMAAERDFIVNSRSKHNFANNVHAANGKIGAQRNKVEAARNRLAGMLHAGPEAQPAEDPSANV